MSTMCSNPVRELRKYSANQQHELLKNAPSTDFTLYKNYLMSDQIVTPPIETPIKMICPICTKEVHKYKETDHPVKNKVSCANEYYQHYDDDKLIKFLHPVEYKAPAENLNYLPLPQAPGQTNIFFSL